MSCRMFRVLFSKDGLREKRSLCITILRLCHVFGTDFLLPDVHVFAGIEVKIVLLSACVKSRMFSERSRKGNQSKMLMFSPFEVLSMLLIGIKVGICICL